MNIDNLPDQKPYKNYKYKLTPFKLCVLQNFPYIEADFDAINNYQLLCKVVEYLNNVISNQNTVESNFEIMKENLNTLYNFLDTLDLQDEVNNKLDEMASDGTLQEIIASFINSNAIWGFNNLADLKNATNLINGSYAITLGYYNKNDDGGSLYKIRERVSTIGNQLFDKYNAVILSGFVNIDNGIYTKADKNQQSLLIPLRPNTTYTIRGFQRRSNIGLFNRLPIPDETISLRYFSLEVGNSLTFTTSSEEIYLVALFNNSSYTYNYNDVMLNYGDTPLPYDSYPDTENGGSIIFLNNNLVAEFIPENDTVNVKQFGAKGDGISDDTEYINNLLKYIKMTKNKIIIPEGIFLTRGLYIDFSNCYIEGINKKLSVIKVLPTINQDSVIYCYNNGILSLNISNISIDGNKENISSNIDGLKLFSDINIPDTYSNIVNNEIYNCSGNGLLLDSIFSNTGVREIRVNNNNIYSNELDGIYFKSTSDSNIFQNTSHGNKQCGYHIKGGNIKLLNNKAHNNGDGDNETLESLYRIPDDAFVITSDISYQIGKNYYIRTGNGTSDVPYVFTLFEGNTFESGVVYYELTGIYYKKYPGYLIEAWSCLISNCESQDSAGDGFYVSNRENVLENILADGNGRLRVNGSLVTYESQGLHQLYDGVYIRNTYNTLISGTFKNFRYNVTIADKYQRSAICLNNCHDIIANIVSSNQIIDIINIKSPKSNLSYNGKYYFYDHDLSLLTLESGISLYSNPSSQNESYIKRQGNNLYIHLIIINSNNFSTSDVSTKIITLPSSMKPKYSRSIFGLVGTNNGVNIKGYSSVYINRVAEIAYRGNTSYGENNQNMVIDNEYILLD